jgi:hypothetical protein
LGKIVLFCELYCRGISKPAPKQAANTDEEAEQISEESLLIIEEAEDITENTPMTALALQLTPSLPFDDPSDEGMRDESQWDHHTGLESASAATEPTLPIDPISVELFPPLHTAVDPSPPWIDMRTPSKSTRGNSLDTPSEWLTQPLTPARTTSVLGTPREPRSMRAKNKEHKILHSVVPRITIHKKSQRLDEEKLEKQYGKFVVVDVSSPASSAQWRQLHPLYRA